MTYSNYSTYISVSLWYLSSTLITIFYRYIGNYHVSAFVGSSGLILQSLVACVYTKKYPKLVTSKNQVYVIITLGMYILLSNVCLQYIPIHVSVMFRSLIPLFCIISAKLSALELPEHHIISNIIFLTIGIILSNLKETYSQTTILGYSLALSTCLFAGLKFTALKRYLTEYESITVLKDTGIYMGLLTMPVGAFQLSQVEFDPIYFNFIFIGTFLGFCISLFEYTVIKKISIWETVLFDTLKEILLIIGSSLFVKLTLTNWLGITLVITSVVSLKWGIYIKEKTEGSVEPDPETLI